MDRVLARLLALALVGIFAFPALSAAQITRGAISGTVRDGTGAVLVDARNISRLPFPGLPDVGV